MKIVHYWRVARRFWPWERAFWLGLLHDSVEDGWLSNIIVARRLPDCYIKWALLALTRSPDGTYSDYIKRIQLNGGDIKRVKVADLLDNYWRAPASLRKRYAKALAMLADD